MTEDAVRRLSAEALDEIYTTLCQRLTERGIEQTPAVLARLVLLLMREVDDPAVIQRAVEQALAG